MLPIEMKRRMLEDAFLSERQRQDLPEMERLTRCVLLLGEMEKLERELYHCEPANEAAEQEN